MKKILFAAILFAAMLLLLITSGCRSRAEERAVFAQDMTDPSAEFSASASGTDNEILVIQLPGTTYSNPENLIEGNSLTTLRNKGFKRVQIKGSDNKIILEKNLD
jgi:hypothetical protein